ncbi:Sec-independent protein translocase subunit TatA [Saccharopolyspora sp. CA-218241]|uniref:Sec-independent protein translocase subunit TatA n=1 Tax=Saccharopolyspora sp. CA-218241 TaxID=3240027 RepID=UPI003D9912B4
MGLPGGWELILIVLVVVLLFGATKLPQMARSLGQSARVFKAEARGMKEDEEREEAKKREKAERESREITSGDSVTPSVTPPVEDKQRDESKN